MSWHEGDPPSERLDHPVTLVRWDDAVAYCAWLSAATGRAFRLPTEAEWEKRAAAACAASAIPGATASIRPWRISSWTRQPGQSTAPCPCRAYPPNGYGVFDMAGNVWEWVHDWYAPDAYAARSARIPAGPPVDICGSSAAAAGCRPTSGC